jgi:hypothetical protein
MLQVGDCGIMPDAGPIVSRAECPALHMPK